MRKLLLVLAFIGLGFGLAFQFGSFDIDGARGLVQNISSEFSYDDTSYYDDYNYESNEFEDISLDEPIKFADYTEYELVDSVYDDSSAIFMKTVSGKVLPYEISYSDIAWELSSENYNEDAEIEITHKYSDLYALVIAEDIEYDIEELRQIILDNYITNNATAIVLYEGEKEINGKQVHEMVTNVSIEDYIFQYHTYYYSGPEGTIQFVVYYEDYLAEIYNDDVGKMLNSLKIL